MLGSSGLLHSDQFHHTPVEAVGCQVAMGAASAQVLGGEEMEAAMLGRQRRPFRRGASCQGLILPRGPGLWPEPGPTPAPVLTRLEAGLRLPARPLACR